MEEEGNQDNDPNVTHLVANNNEVILNSSSQVNVFLDCSTTNQLGVMSSKEKSVIVDSTNQIDEDVKSFAIIIGLTNFVLTVAGVSAVVLLLRSDVKQSANIFRCNVKHIRNWLEEETAASSKEMQKSAKELESKVPPKESPKEDKH
ncbi:uncharacterized protein LOC107635853 [Arachis ipaensis]|uniref:uncharacterized protein LOC107635853 n=1 Tax=Arachis ipaensis TaxID=130454 RepID=UPI000A2B2599|nr:uncharacterized protein LOC107635853 [Arachis ipaensis]